MSWKRTATLFLVSQALSLFGTALVQYALLWHVTLTTKSGVVMTVYILCGFVPAFFVSPFAGVWADRMDRKRLMILSDGTIALVTLLLALVMQRGGQGGQAMWLIMLTAAVRAVGQAVQMPAVGAFLPQFVPPDQLTRINGIQSTIQSATFFGAPVLAGFLMSVWPLAWVFLLDVVTAAVAIAMLAFLVHVPPHERAAKAEHVSYFEDLAAGFVYVRGHRFFLAYFAFVGGLLILVAPAAFLTPLQVTRTYGSDVWRLTAIEMVFSVGMMIGGALMAAWGGFRNRIHTMFLSTGIMGACTVLLGVMPNFWVYLVPMGVFGLALPLYNAAAMVLVQEQSEPELLGRVMGVFTMLSMSMMPLGMLIFGPLAEVVRIEWLLIATGAAMLLQLLWVSRNRTLVEGGLAPATPAGTGDANDAKTEDATTDVATDATTDATTA
ncbi:MAG: MFS transporter [Gemmatimonadaceae bacterium]|nr:MFS transporter [Gemmatimonadaceae bacterium]